MKPRVIVWALLTSASVSVIAAAPGAAAHSLADIAAQSRSPRRLCMGDAAPPPAASTAASPTVHATIADAAWLAGFWVGGAAPRTFEERWTSPAGGSMLALSRTVSNGALTAFEFLCITERDGGLVYTAMSNGRTPPTDFTLTHLTPDSLTFENPAHDFPKMIRYARRPDGSLEATISGEAGARPQTFVFRKQ